MPTVSQVEKRLCYWQKRLRLQDWDIDIALVPGNHFSDSKHTDAEVECVAYQRAATIRVNESLAKDGLDLTLVHELLHVHLWPLFGQYIHERDEYRRHLAEQMEEQIIWAISEAIVSDE